MYSLTPVGLHLLEGRDVMDTLHVTIPQQLGSQNEHLLLINAVRIALIDELPDAGGTLSGWRSDWELRQPGQKGLVPDALFMVGWHGQKAQAHMLEVENRTKSSRRLLKRMLTYSSRLERNQPLYGVNDFLVLVVGKPQKVKRYRRALTAMGDKPWLWFATVDDLTHHGVLAAVWQPLGECEKQSLPTLPKRPYRVA